jgi:hypothetical protein
MTVMRRDGEGSWERMAKGSDGLTEFRGAALF